jgi:2-keto-3-deoxy-L-arabinonate dehydratase
MPTEITGVLPVAHTPFHEDETIDFDSLARQIDWAFGQGIQGCCTGMVSELLRLDGDERAALNRRLAELCHGRGLFVAGIGAESTRQALRLAQAAESAGCDALMAIPPVTTAVAPDQLRGYFQALARQTNLPLIVQDASSYVGQSIPLSICIQLLDEFGADRILFKPEANPIGPNLSALRDATGGRVRIFEGSGGLTLVDSYRRGIVGTIPGMEFLPGVVALWRALERGDEQTIYAVSLPLGALVQLQLQAGLDGFLAIEKYLLWQRGLFRTSVRRRPYRWELDEETQRELHRLLECLDAAVQAAAHQDIATETRNPKS